MKKLLSLLIAISAVAAWYYIWTPKWLLEVCYISSIAAVSIVAIDKFCAVQRWSRLPEWLFFIATLAGGWGAMALSFIVFNHKHNKHAFFWPWLVLSIVSAAAIYAIPRYL
ncbi:DUF1294 domain-containing protein [Paraferrimonas sp. SM1919]|uniref:DUF1294 domain-containing protein n=1 Tax=Paraferrimonas sp. SM1919 TaxID=2662263 RepID=UPI0013D3444B|nr:DUF1294 domain-containing protein [Paraferrimonas sp. SM1919]